MNKSYYRQHITQRRAPVFRLLGGGGCPAFQRVDGIHKLCHSKT